MKHETRLNAARVRLRVLGLFIAIGFLLVSLSLIYSSSYKADAHITLYGDGVK